MSWPLEFDVHAMRNGNHGRDVAILDLLHLIQMELVPGRVTVPLLRHIWGLSQSQVSRRMSAIDEIGIVSVCTDNRGAYLIEVHDVPSLRPVDSRTPQERWESARQHLQRLIERQ